MPAFERPRREHGALERLIEVPPVVSGRLARILDRRIGMAVDAGREEALTDVAADALAELNRTRTGRNLRTTLGVAHSTAAPLSSRGDSAANGGAPEEDPARARDGPRRGEDGGPRGLPRAAGSA